MVLGAVGLGGPGGGLTVLVMASRQPDGDVRTLSGKKPKRNPRNGPRHIISGSGAGAPVAAQDANADAVLAATESPARHPPPPRLPDDYHHHRSVVRILRARSGDGPVNPPVAPDEGLIGIGFLLKYQRSVDHVDLMVRHYSVVLVLRGSGRYRAEDGREWPLSPGWCFQRLTTHRHSNWIDPDSRWSEVFLAFGPSLTRQLTDLGVIQPDPPVFYTGFDPTLIARFMAARDQLADAPEHELTRCLATSIDLLGELRALQSAPADPLGALMARASRELASDLGQRMDLDALAGRLGLGYERFRKLFRERVGTPPGEYRIRRRLERARELLGLREQSISDIAGELGYQNPFAFSIQFKRYTGVSPSAYQRLR